MIHNPADGSCAERANGAAKRRRERRLRSWLRHERMTVAAELAAALHHSRDVGPGTHVGLRAQKTVSSGGRRPGVLKEPEPPNVVDRVLRRTVDQIVDAVPGLPALDVPVPQMEDPFVDNLNLVDAMDAVRLLDRPISEQVIEVPKFIIDDIPTRTSVHEPQMAEQLVEVPTVISYYSLQRSVEQHVDIPVPGGRGPSSGLQGFSSGQLSTASPTRQRISERIVEQIVDPVSRGSLLGSLPGQSSSSSHSPAGVEERADEPGDGVFRTFPQGKKCGGCRAGQCGPAQASQLMDPGG